MKDISAKNKSSLVTIESIVSLPKESQVSMLWEPEPESVESECCSGLAKKFLIPKSETS